MSPEPDLLSIGEVARRCDLPITTVRHYDRIGLVAARTRVGDKRRYLPRAVDRILFVRRCLGVGFSLPEVLAILETDDGGWRSLVEARIGELVDQRSRIDTMISALSGSLTCDCLEVTSCRTELRG